MPTPKNDASPLFATRFHEMCRSPSRRFFLALVERLQLRVRRRVPGRRARARRLVDLQVGAGMVAQPVPVAVGEPGRADHRARLVRGPEAEQRGRAAASAMRVNTRASSIMQALPAALSVAASPGQESWWPPTRTKSSGSGVCFAGNSAIVICTGRQPFVTCVRNHTRTGPLAHISLELQPRGARDADAGQRRASRS